jgi:uncharacterized protein YegP (UPF0339 family)
MYSSPAFREADEFYQDKSSEWRWRRTASNGEIVGAASEGYVNRSDCEANAHRDGSKDRFEVYEDKSSEWRWQSFSTANGKQVGKSSEGYVNRSDCEANATRFGYSK